MNCSQVSLYRKVDCVRVSLFEKLIGSKYHCIYLFTGQLTVSKWTILDIWLYPSIIVWKVDCIRVGLFRRVDCSQLYYLRQVTVSKFVMYRHLTVTKYHCMQLFHVDLVSVLLVAFSGTAGYWWQGSHSIH